MRRLVLLAVLIVPLALFFAEPNRRTFFAHFLKHPTQIGALAPSSPALAAEVTRLITTAPTPHRLLEIGAGTGAFTHEIVRKMGPHDHLDVVEYDPDFAAQLSAQFSHLPNVTVHCCSITTFNSPPYDTVISGLPLNAFSPELVDEILRKYTELTKEEGTLSYFEYIGLDKLKKSLTYGLAHQNFRSVLRLKEKFLSCHETETASVYKNFPPARVVHCHPSLTLR